MEEEYRTSSNFHRYINTVEIRVPCAPPTIQCRYDSGIHEFDRAMANVTFGLAQDLMVDILISKVRVKRKRSGFATYTDMQHHGIQTDLLSRKWGIVLDKAKSTLHSTTQDNVRSALKPLTWRYRTTFAVAEAMSTELHILYRNSIYKGKSIFGNICAQIFTNRE